MSDFYNSGGYSSQPHHGAGGNEAFYNQSSYGQQSGGGSGANSQPGGAAGGYGAYDGSTTQQPQPQQQSWHQPSPAPAAQPAMGMVGGGPTKQQATGPSQPFFNPSMATAAISGVAAKGFTNDAMFTEGTKVVSHFLDQGTARLIPGLDLFMRTLRVYFAVDNRYVKRKMQRVLFPFLYKDWARLEDDASSTPTSVAFAPPIQDENAFDLYIPSMALITYVLLCALCYGTAGEFNPEVLPDVTTKCFVTQILEVVVVRGGFYAMQAPCSLLDLFSATGYKYLGLSINMLVGLLLGHLGWGHRGYYGTFLWTASAASYFMLKTMANNTPRVTAGTGPKREFMVLGFAASQFATMW
eukprot:CAMPEP_0113559948 /NCGR_PEP_ID=MMETSP0015_2-20120614/19170_1 /TAXON_ID=2838 /ORGANISM="Odontella" /LENGTH=353 /DNA_ID=CAMNT_0000461621 /DNA_START=168 /DNA_END=1226 /DNA_ORIENTATION=- /assembly_acc=CAM_ASM_000160